MCESPKQRPYWQKAESIRQPSRAHEMCGLYLVNAHICLASGKTDFDMMCRNRLSGWKNGNVCKKNKKICSGNWGFIPG